MEEKNITIYNKKILQRYFQKSFQNSKDLEVVFKITIDNLKQILLKKDEAIQNYLIEINKYKKINMKTMQSQVQH